MILGVDPGKTGALAWLSDTGALLYVHDVPTLKAGTGGKAVVDEAALAGLVQSYADITTHAFIEMVGARPGQGVTSMFNFGTTYGLLRGVIAANGIPRTFVTPGKWKKALGVSAEKDSARARASQLMPQHAANWTRVKDDGRAEAAMIAYYGAKCARA